MKLILALCLLFISCSPVYYVKSESVPYVQTYYPRYYPQYNNNYPAGYYHPRYVRDYVDRDCEHEKVYRVNEYRRGHHRR